MTLPIISFKNFTFKYDAQAEPTVYNINLDIYTGEKVLIIGPSGSGKSTIASCINGLIPFCYKGESTGTLFVDNREAKKASIFELSNTVGTVLQDPDCQFIGLTVAEDIAFSLENDCVEQEKMHEIVKNVSKIVGADKLLEHAPHELSGGQKQRVSLGGVMVDKVKVLLFDEPLANLDPETGKKTIELIDEIQHKTNTTIIIIEHRLEDVLWKNVDRIILMNDGRIASDTTPDELLSGNLLVENGIREPLYITAMKYAGINIMPSMYPHSIKSLSLSEKNINNITNWYNNTVKPEAEAKNEQLLEIKNISFGYTKERKTLDNISFIINKGEMISIVGKNGAGKSTLSKLLCGFEAPDSGDILLKGKSLLSDNIRMRARSIGYVLQNPNQMISKPMIFDEVAFGLRNMDKAMKLSDTEINKRVEETLKICGLYRFRKWPISALSFGQKKRVTIASVLVMQPEIIILDEPTAGQDFKHYTEIMEFLLELNKKGVTVIMITHDMHLMLEYTSRALVFSDGRLIDDKPSSSVLCDMELINCAALKETSLFTLANMCSIKPAESFVQSFIDFDREVREHGK